MPILVAFAVLITGLLGVMILAMTQKLRAGEISHDPTGSVSPSAAAIQTAMPFFIMIAGLWAKSLASLLPVLLIGGVGAFAAAYAYIATSRKAARRS